MDAITLANEIDRLTSTASDTEALVALKWATIATLITEDFTDEQINKFIKRLDNHLDAK